MNAYPESWVGSFYKVIKHTYNKKDCKHNANNYTNLLKVVWRISLIHLLHVRNCWTMLWGISLWVWFDCITMMKGLREFESHWHIHHNLIYSWLCYALHFVPLWKMVSNVISFTTTYFLIHQTYLSALPMNIWSLRTLIANNASSTVVIHTKPYDNDRVRS